MKIQQREILFASVAGLIAAVAILAMPQLVAAPKVLFGRSLSAIAPSLFPYITLALIAFLSAVVILLSWYSFKQPKMFTEKAEYAESEINAGWGKTGAFFVILTGYGFLLKPVGFLISSFFVISALSLMLGNRNWLQILLLAILAPIGLYLIATRAMLVSLPEISQIELWYAHTISWLTDRVTQ